MPTPRKPRHLHLLQGTYRKDRHGQTPQRVEPMDPTPPKWLTAAEKRAWTELTIACKPYLAQSDRVAVEMAARLIAADREGKLTSAKQTLLCRLLEKIGATPESRARLVPINAGVAPANPFDDLDKA